MSNCDPYSDSRLRGGWKKRDQNRGSTMCGGIAALSRVSRHTPTQSDQAPDLVLAATPDYMFGNESDGDLITHGPPAGTHGYLNSDPQMQAIFIAWGAGVPKGIQLGDISNLDVAPTVAALLGIEMKRAKGHAIEQIGKRSLR